MNTVTHACLPAILYAGVSLVRRKPLDWRWVVGIAAMGAAPDVLDPHLSLEARFTSWTHSLLGMAIMLSVPLFGACVRQLKWSHFMWFTIAYGLHLVCDAIAGGICVLRPWDDRVIGAYYTMPITWWYYDGFCLITMFVLWDLNRKWHGTRLLWWKT